MTNKNQIQDSTTEKANSRERQSDAEWSSLPDGIEEVNGKLYDWTSGREFLNVNPKAVRVALDNLKRDQEKVVPYDVELDNYFSGLMTEKENEKIDYPRARVEFYRIWRKNLGKKPIVHENDRWIIENFVKWIISDPDGVFSPDKGLLFCGVQGCGKSELMRSGIEFSNKFGMRKMKFARIGAIFLELNGAKNWAKAIEPYLTGHWCFDDMAQMNEDIVVYSKLNIVETLVNYRVGNKWITLATTNLSPSEVEGKYGRTVASRFNQMFEAVEFETQTDYRTL